VALKYGDGLYGILQRYRRNASLRCDAGAGHSGERAERTPRPGPRRAVIASRQAARSLVWILRVLVYSRACDAPIPSSRCGKYQRVIDRQWPSLRFDRS